MLIVKKYGSNNYGVWVLGTLQYEGLEITKLFKTNLKDQNFFDGVSQIRPKKVKIFENRNHALVFTLEF